DLTVVVLANAGQADTQRFVDGIARIYNPALAPDEAPIPDADPKVTEQARALLAFAAKGTLKAGDFAYVDADFVKAMNEAYSRVLKDQGEPRLELLERKALGDDIEYRYRAIYPAAAYRVMLQVNGAGVTELALRALPQATVIRNARLIDGTGARSA